MSGNILGAGPLLGGDACEWSKHSFRLQILSEICKSACSGMVIHVVAISASEPALEPRFTHLETFLAQTNFKTHLTSFKANLYLVKFHPSLKQT